MSVRSAVARESAVTGLEDLSADMRALRVQGTNAIAWLEQNGVTCPDLFFALYQRGSKNDSILVARVGNADVIVQGGAASKTLDALSHALRESTDVFQVPEEAATFRLSGPGAEDLWRQTCAIPLANEPVDKIIYTRVAGVSCAVIPEDATGRRSYRIWVDYSYAKALWQSLADILAD